MTPHAAGTPETPGSANPGLVRPPQVYFTSIVAGLALEFFWPLRLVPPRLSLPLGAAAVVIAVALFITAVRTFRAAGTPVPGNQPTSAIVRTGPYRYTRNPIYLAFSLLQVGIGFWANSVWLLLTLIPAVLLMSLVVIPREESYLEARFPAEYLPYKKSVRRWF